MGDIGVIEQMRRSLPRGWSAFKIAVDGDCIRDVLCQTENLPTHATHLIVSVGGNDLIGYSHLLSSVRSLNDAGSVLAAPKATFAALYGEMLDQLQQLPVQLGVCTVYTAIPFEEPLLRSFGAFAIGQFNELICEQAAVRNVPVFRLDQVCTESDDFSAVSPIEPSSKGGQKIVDGLIAFLSDAA
ncbi:MAG: SGNH/GDSL hydrolase family protein [Terricaulis sp.]